MLKIQGRGYLMFFAKIPRGVKAFRKNCLVGSPYFGFYCIFINKCFEKCLRGVSYLPSPLTPTSPPPPVCIYEHYLQKKLQFSQIFPLLNSSILFSSVTVNICFKNCIQKYFITIFQQRCQLSTVIKLCLYK